MGVGGGPAAAEGGRVQVVGGAGGEQRALRSRCASGGVAISRFTHRLASGLAIDDRMTGVLVGILGIGVLLR